MTCWLKACIALAEDMGLVPHIHTRQLTTTCHSNSRVSDAPIWPPQAPAHMWCTSSYSGPHTELKKIYS